MTNIALRDGMRRMNEVDINDYTQLEITEEDDFFQVNEKHKRHDKKRRIRKTPKPE